MKEHVTNKGLSYTDAIYALREMVRRELEIAKDVGSTSQSGRIAFGRGRSLMYAVERLEDLIERVSDPVHWYECRESMIEAMDLGLSEIPK